MDKPPPFWLLEPWVASVPLSWLDEDPEEVSAAAPASTEAVRVITTVTSRVTKPEVVSAEESVAVVAVGVSATTEDWVVVESMKTMTLRVTRVVSWLEEVVSGVVVVAELVESVEVVCWDESVEGDEEEEGEDSVTVTVDSNEVVEGDGVGSSDVVVEEDEESGFEVGISVEEDEESDGPTVEVLVVTRVKWKLTVVYL